jgi:phosphate-selective porin OprO/OprP
MRNLLSLTVLLCAPVTAVAQDALPRGEAIAFESVPGPYGERMTLDDKGLTLTFPEDAAKLRIGGKLQLDFGAAGIRQPGFADPFSDNIAVRRSWIESYLALGKTLEFAFQYDFADANTPINDAVVVYRGIPEMLFSVGNQKEPFSLDQLTGDNSTVFTERSLADGFAPGRNFGFTIGRNGADWTAVTSVFGGNANTGIRSQGIASTTRVTYAPINTGVETLHFALAGSLRSLPRHESPLSLSSRSEAFLFTRPFAATGSIRDADSVGRIGAEAAYRNGSLLVMAEYIRTEVGRFDGARPLTFQGGYVQASYVLNGDNRAYRLVPHFSGTTYATFAGVEVPEAKRITRGGFGVFEVGTRFSAIDLDDGGIRGGIERDVTVGLTWYPDRNIRIMADYVRTHTSATARSSRALDADAFIGRFQLYW